MLAIFKREFKNFFQNVIGWVFIAGMVFIGALYFNAYNIGYGFSDILMVLVRLLMIFVFSLPVLSMRILTEERKQKIDQLTLTSPVTVGKIVLGKYFAMVAVLVITTIVIGAFPLLLSGYTTVDWGTNGLALLGFILYGSACLAICMFVSSFTESQVIAAIVGIVSMFAIYIMSGITYMLENTQNTMLAYVAKGLSVLDLVAKFDSFVSGILDIKVIVYFISLIAVFLFLTVQAVQKRRYTTSVKNLALNAFSFTSIIIVIAIAIIANLITKQFPAKYMEYDLTEQRLYSLCDATKEVIAQVNEPVSIYIYADENDKDDAVDRLLEKYADLNSNIKVEYKSPAKSPKFYEKFADKSPSYNSLFMISGDRTKVVDYNNMYVTDYNVSETGQYEEVRSYDIEGQITSALNYLNTGLTAKVYEVTGHGENALESGYVDAIGKQNYELNSISLINEDIPDDCELLVINAPVDDFSADDAKKVLSFADKGGNILVSLGMQDEFKNTMPNFNSILDYYGLTVKDGLVVDLQMAHQMPYFILPNVESDTITNGVFGKKMVWMPYVKALSFDDADMNVISFLNSSESSYIKDSEAVDYLYSEGDEVGPFAVGVYAVKNSSDGNSTCAYVVGSPNMFTDTADQTTANANLTIFMNIVNKSVENDYAAVVVPVKSMDSERFVISSSAGLIIFLVLFIVLPVALLITGFVIWAKRRKR